jgi:GH15 family glucan-1,4-alpha-glucosidase
MCWAACDRLARIATRLGEPARAARWRREAERIREGTLARAWSAKRKSLVSTFEGEELDASLLLLHEIGFVAPEDPRFTGTVAAIETDLRRGSYLLRYCGTDDFGTPHCAFNICTFWYIGALAALGRRDEARELFENMLARRTRLGLLSEDLDPSSGELWGNFPQTYSMVGLINAAMRLSRGWEEAF